MQQRGEDFWHSSLTDEQLRRVWARDGSDHGARRPDDGVIANWAWQAFVTPLLTLARYQAHGEIPGNVDSVQECQHMAAQPGRVDADLWSSSVVANYGKPR